MGHGVYFAVNSSFSDKYSESLDLPDLLTSDAKKMFRARVLVGESCLGDKTMKEPPKKLNGDRYDSTTDSTNIVYACFHDNQCYPEYILTYFTV